MSPQSERRRAFDYRALERSGTEHHGSVLAVSEEEARERLAALGLFPVRITERSKYFRWHRTPGAADRALGLRLLASLLGSSLSIERGLEVFATVAPATWSMEDVESLRAAVREGTPFAEGLAQADLGIPGHSLGVIEAGESGGQLVRALEQVASATEADARQRSALTGALAYPLVLAVAGTASVIVLVIVVIPRFAELLGDVGQRLPPSASLLLAVGGAAVRFGPLLAILVAAIIAATTWRLSNDRDARFRVHEILLRVPVIGALRHSIATARASAALGGLLAGGMPIAAALQQSAPAAGDESVSSRLGEVRQRVIRGEALSHALRDTGALRDSATRMVRAGEAIGDVGAMLLAASRLEETWSESRIRRLTQLVEPMLILTFGSVIAFVAGALLQAVYALRPVS